LDKAKAAINAHSSEYLDVALAGEKATGKKGVVLVEAGRPSRFVEDLSTLPKRAHSTLRKMIKEVDQMIVVVEVDGTGGVQAFRVSREPSADGFLNATEPSPLPS
jgi:hypothetical protein